MNGCRLDVSRMIKGGQSASNETSREPNTDGVKRAISRLWPRCFGTSPVTTAPQPETPFLSDDLTLISSQQGAHNSALTVTTPGPSQPQPASLHQTAGADAVSPAAPGSMIRFSVPIVDLGSLPEVSTLETPGPSQPQPASLHQTAGADAVSPPPPTSAGIAHLLKPMALEIMQTNAPSIEQGTVAIEESPSSPARSMPTPSEDAPSKAAISELEKETTANMKRLAMLQEELAIQNWLRDNPANTQSELTRYLAEHAKMERSRAMKNG